MSTIATTNDQQISFENVIDARSQALLGDHRIGGQCVLPAAAQIDMALSGYELLAPGREITLSEVFFRMPVAAPADGAVELRLSVDARSCQLWSRSHAGEQWQNAMEGAVKSHYRSAPVYRSVADLHQRCPRAVEFERLQRWYQVCGATYGPIYRTLRTLALGPSSALALLDLTMPADPAAQHRVHPAILDGAVQALILSLMAETDVLQPAAAAFTPWHLRAVLSRRPVQGPVWCAIEREAPANGAGECVTGSCWLMSRQGEVLLELQGMTLRGALERAGTRIAMAVAEAPPLIAPPWLGAPERSSVPESPTHAETREWAADPAHLQQRLVEMFREALRAEHIGPDDDVLELGLDSMMAIEVASSLADLGFQIDPPLLFDLPTVRQLAAHLVRPHRHLEPAPPVARPGAPPTPSSPVPHTFLERRLAERNKEDYAIRDRGDYFFEPVVTAARGGWIETGGRWLLNFTSYTYLDLIGHPHIDQCAREAIARFGTGTHGVRLLAGTMELHCELEQTIATFKGTEDAVVFSSGYMANLATIAALVGPGDYIIGDIFNHASIVDGCRLSGATFLQFAHNDLRDLERSLVKAGSAGKLVVVDAVFSMDGDIIDLPGVVGLCQKYDAALMVDEAHSLGVLGATGHGIEEHFGLPATSVPIKMGTLSKTIPSVGGYVAGSKDLIFALKQNARGFAYSGAITPAQTAAAKAAFEIIAASPERTRKLAANTQYYRTRLHALGFDTLRSETAITPVVCRSAAQACEFARLCQRRGLFVQPIVYPVVPTATPRLRTIVTAGHTTQDLDTAIEVLTQAGREIGLIEPS